MTTIPGIHHVTAIAGSAARNVRFYTQVLGTRLVKKTVNFDDPGTYHLYYGDPDGRPGSIMTFFPFENASPGRPGTGSVVETAFAVPDAVLESWLERFADVDASGEYERFSFQPLSERMGRRILTFHDPDGLPLSFVGHSESPHPHGSFDGVTLELLDPDPTARLLIDVMGYSEVAQEGSRLRLVGDDSAPGAYVDLIPSAERGRPGAGTVHHVAFRAKNDQDQIHWQERITDAGLYVTEVKDRQYFRSIYFREPGGVLFEIATDPPGFTVDESPAQLGTGLMLPPWLEGRRPGIEKRLPDLELDPQQA